MSDTTTCYTSIGFFLIPTLWKVRLQLNILWKEDHHELQIRTQTNRGISTLSHLPWLHTNFNHYQEHPNYRGSFLFIIWYYAPMQITAHPTAGWNTLPIPLVQESGSAQSQIFRNGFAAVSNIKRCPSFDFWRAELHYLLSSRQKPPGQIQNIRLAQRQYRIEYNYPCKKIQGFSFSRLPKFTN